MWKGVVLASLCIVACGGAQVSDAGADASTDAPSDADAGLVRGGDPCGVDGSTAPGWGPFCTDTGGRRTTCTCRSGGWDCGKCPDCKLDLRAPIGCGLCAVCNLGTATRCDGTSFTPKECHGGCGIYLDWVCIDSVGDRFGVCPQDAGTD